MCLEILQRFGSVLLTGDHCRRMAHRTTDSWIAYACAKQLFTALRTGSERHRCRRSESPHKSRELQPVRQDMKRIVKPLVSNVTVLGARNDPCAQAGTSFVR